MIFDLIKKRRSIFPVQYNDKPIAKEAIVQLLEAANWAPTHKKTEPWRFKVMQGKSKEDLGVFLSTKYQEVEDKPKQVKIKKLMYNPTKSAAVIAICMHRDSNDCTRMGRGSCSCYGRTEYVVMLHRIGYRVLLEFSGID